MVWVVKMGVPGVPGELGGPGDLSGLSDLSVWS